MFIYLAYFLFSPTTPAILASLVSLQHYLMHRIRQRPHAGEIGQPVLFLSFRSQTLVVILILKSSCKGSYQYGLPGRLPFSFGLLASSEAALAKARS